MITGFIVNLMFFDIEPIALVFLGIFNLFIGEFAVVKKYSNSFCESSCVPIVKNNCFVLLLLHFYYDSLDEIIFNWYNEIDLIKFDWYNLYKISSYLSDY
jgi:hypothetical protein